MNKQDKKNRDQRLNLRLSSEELELLERLSKDLELSRTEVIATLIREFTEEA